VQELKEATAWTSLNAAAFTLVLARILGFVMSLPGFGAGVSLWSSRVAMAILLTLLVAPTCLVDSTAWRVPEVPAASEQAPRGQQPAAAIAEAVAHAEELILGLILGLSTALLLVGVQVAGQLASQISGTSLAAVASGEAVVAGPPLARLFRLLCVAFFFAFGGHRQVVSGLLTSFRDHPLGTGFSFAACEGLLTVLSRSFVVGFEIAAPVMAALLAALLVVSMLGRLIPHLDVWSVTTATGGLAMVAAIFFCVGLMGWTIDAQLPALVRDVFVLIRTE
jgi:flagellar biosynthetic protein FliR